MYALGIQIKVFFERLMPIDSRSSLLIAVFPARASNPRRLNAYGVFVIKCLLTQINIQCNLNLNDNLFC
jgi:hypothetical protein